MKFTTQTKGKGFEIPDDWWEFSEMNEFELNGGGFYPYSLSVQDVKIINIDVIEPPARNKNIISFKKYKLIPVLLGFKSPECALPPVEAQILNTSNTYKYKIINGYHRFYASVAVGYKKLPIIIVESHEL